MPKKKKPKRDFHLSVFFRTVVSFSVTVLLFFTSVFVYNTFLANSSAAQKAFNSGNSFFDKELYASALEHYIDAVTLDESNVDYRLKLALCYEKVGDEQNVIKTVDEGVYLAPNEYRYPAFMVGYYARAGKMSSAYEVLDSVTSLSVKSKLDSISPLSVSISPSASSHEKINEVVLSCDESCDIYYTIDGSAPSLSSSKYTAPIDVSGFESSFTVKAFSVNAEGLISRVTTVYYNFDDPNQKYVFKDAKMAELVATMLGKKSSNITRSDLEFLTEIDSSLYTGKGSVKSLADLPNFKNLKVLYLKDEQSITEFCDFAVLSTLESLSLINCNVSNATFKSICTAPVLTYLDLSTNFISNAAPVNQLTALKTAIFDQNQLTSLTAFQSNKALEVLSVSFNKITSLSPLKSLTKLKNFSAAYNSISSITDLEKCTAITKLNLSGNQITSVNALSKLNALTDLDLSGNSITSVSALSGKTKLKNVNLSKNPVINLSYLSSSAISTLTLRNCGITDLSELASLNVTTLDLSNSPATSDMFEELNAFIDLAPLNSMDSLRYLKINNVTSVTSLAPLSGNEHINSIYCAGCTELSFGDFDNSTDIKLIK